MKKIFIDLSLADFLVQLHEDDTKENDTCYYITHLQSGAIGISSKKLSQLENKKQALLRCINSKQFQKWYKKKKLRETEDLVDINTWLRMNCF